jgi:hypothetical protein
MRKDINIVRNEMDYNGYLRNAIDEATVNDYCQHNE